MKGSAAVLNKLAPCLDKEELRWRYTALRLAMDIAPWATITSAIKISIREYTRKPVDEVREIYDDGCKYITLNPLPESIQTEAEAEYYVEAKMLIPKPSEWNLIPGDIYSTRYKLCQRNGRWWAYLYYLVIQY